MTKCIFCLTELETFAEWVHYRYGTFAEVGSDLDPRYPAYHSNGLLEEPTISHGCNLTLDDEQMVDASILRNKVRNWYRNYFTFPIITFWFHLVRIFQVQNFHLWRFLSSSKEKLIKATFHYTSVGIRSH